MELDLDWRRRFSALWPEVSYELRPLRVWAFQELLGFWEGQVQAHASPAGAGQEEAAQPADSPSPVRSSLAATAGLMEAARRIFPEHVRGVAGLQVRTEAGAGPAEVAQLCEEAPLLPLAAEIVAALIDISTLGEAAEKN